MPKQYFKNGYVIILTLACFFFFSAPAHAGNASIFFKPVTQTIGVGDEFSVPLLLNTDGTMVNTIAGDLTFTDPTLSLTRVLTANSIVTSWIEAPTISGNGVTFSGIMPGGYDSVINPVGNTRNPGLILTLVFTAKSAGSATLAFSESHLYLNDGLGTETPAITLPYTLTIEKVGSGQKEEYNDILPPESFTPIVSSSPDLFEGAYALFFSTTDKGSGIDHYEVSEGKKEWVRTESPYELTDQTLRSRIRVKAVDLAGNYHIEQIGGALTFSYELLFIPLGILIILLIALHIFYKRRMKKLEERHSNE